MGMGRFVSWRPPPIFQSKQLCLSLLYLVTTISISLYSQHSSVGCIFSLLPSPSSFTSSSRPHHPQRLYSYPPTYGEHKHALPTTRTTCNSPLLFPEYGLAWKEINDICRDSSSSSSPSSDLSSVLNYLTARDIAGVSFAGNLSTQKRRSFFNHEDAAAVRVPCGFFKEFPISQSDRLAMGKCNGVVVASAIFGDYDKIRQPKGLGAETLRTVCFFMFIDGSTLKGLNAHNILLPTGTSTSSGSNVIGAWRIVRVPAKKRSLPYKNPAMNGVIPKHLLHRFFPNSKFSIWVDAKLQLTVDPLLLIHSLLISKDVDMAISKHPFNIHTMEEAMATARWRKWRDIDALRQQMEDYCENGLQPWSSAKLPYTTDVPDTALILRRHGLRSNLFSCLLFNELEYYNPRDQLAFAYVRDLMSPRIRIHMFEVEIFEQVAVEYRHNLKPLVDGKVTRYVKTSGMPSLRDINGSSCKHYLLKMWGESTE